MTLFVVRHAKAKGRDGWAEPDDLRPLTRRGRAQSEGLIGMLAPHPISRLVSSPFVRCVQTLAPLAAARGLPLEMTDDLAEGTSGPRALDLVERLTEPAALCSHGDVIMLLVEALAVRGVPMDGPEIPQKGSTWVLERDGSAIVRGRYLPPPPA